MSDKRQFNNVVSGTDRVKSRSNEIDEILKLPSRDLRLYIQAIWEEQNRDKSLVKELKKAKNKVEKENERLKEQNVDLLVELKRIEALEDALKKTDEENQNLKKQNASLQETEKKLVEFQTLNETLDRQFVIFCDMSAWAAVGFAIADILFGWITTDFGSLTKVNEWLFYVGIGLRVLGAAVIWISLYSANLFKYLFKNNKKRVENNSCEGSLQQKESVS